MLRMSLLNVLGVISFGTTTIRAAVLGESCANGTACSTPFSECSFASRICVCQGGFRQSGSTCTPNGYNCPVGEPYTLNDQVIQCVRRTRRIPDPRVNRGEGFIPTLSLVSLQNYSGGRPGSPFSANLEMPSTRNDTCPEGYTCFTYGPETLNTTVQSGHCCLMQRPVCPVGDRLENAMCEFGPILVPGQILCPLETHYCFRSLVDAGLMCCPKPCTAIGAIYRNRRCYNRVGIGQICEFDDQCVTENSLCLDSGIADTKRCACETPQIYVQLLNICSIPQCGFQAGSLPQRDQNGEFIRCRNPSISPIGVTDLAAPNTNVPCPNGWRCDPIFEVCCAQFGR